jgi:hypothetical protein
MTKDKRRRTGRAPRRRDPPKPPPDGKLALTDDVLAELGRLVEPLHHELLETIRGRYGDGLGGPMHGVALAMLFGLFLKNFPQPEHASSVVAHIWARIGVQFDINMKRVQ